MVAEVAAEAAGRSVMFLHKPLVIDDGTRENVTLTAAARERVLGAFGRCDGDRQWARPSLSLRGLR